ncbi:MAG TPA: tetratricopeptide repeat protein [Armatimonadetes bacterium]|nr:tetratricopeptide repeat protein [Armatimonadota bacterium]
MTTLLLSVLWGGVLAPAAGEVSPVRQAAAQACLVQGRTLYREQDWEAADQLLATALWLNPNLLEAYYWRGCIAFNRGAWTRAAQFFKQVLLHKPHSINSLYELARVLEVQGRREEARVLYRRVLELSPEHREAQHALLRVGFGPTRPELTVEKVIQTADQPPAARRLLRKLERQEPVTIAVLGDSLATGFGLAEPEQDAYPNVVVRLLSARFHHPNLRLVNAGVPGSTAGQAVGRLDTKVLPAQPDLVIVQFGGNDSYQRVPLTEYRAHLRQMVERSWQEAQAAVILVAPIIDKPGLDTPYPQAVRALARELNVPLADFDAALKSHPADYRGYFPEGTHPHEYGHALMALEVYRAFNDLVGTPLPVTAELVEGNIIAQLGEEVTVRARVRNLRAQEQVIKVSLAVERTAQQRELTLPPRAERTVAFPVALPKVLPHGRSLSWRLRLMAQVKFATDFDLKWLTVAPVWACPQVRTEEVETLALRKKADSFSVQLGEPHIRVGQAKWDGLYDSSAAFRLARDEEYFYVTVRVRDDRVRTGTEPFQGDGVTFYFDLRPAPERGRPVRDARCFTIFAAPRTRWEPHSRLAALGEEPPQFALWQVRSLLYSQGYELQLSVPLKTLAEIAGEPLTAFGFDLSVTDEDSSLQSPVRFFWLGEADDFVNPRRYGEVSLTDTLAPGTVRVGVF